MAREQQEGGDGSSWIRRGDKCPREVGARGTVGEVNPSSERAQKVKSGIIQDTNVLVRRQGFLPRENLRKPTQKIRLDPGETLDHMSNLWEGKRIQKRLTAIWGAGEPQPPRVNAGSRLG